MIKSVKTYQTTIYDKKKSDHLVRDQYESLPSQTTWWNVGPIQLVELDLLLADAFLTDIFRPCYVCEVKNYHF